MYEIPGFQISARLGPLGAQARKYRFVKLTADGVEPADNPAEDVILGVLQRDGIVPEDTAAEVVPVMVSGVSMVEANEAIAKGALVGPSIRGKAITVISESVTSGTYSGIALEAATKDGDVIPVLLCPNSYRAGT